MRCSGVTTHDNRLGYETVIAFCGLKGDDAANAAAMPQPTASPEGDQSSSYSTGESEPEAPVEVVAGLEVVAHKPGIAWMESLEEIKSCIAKFDATQRTLVNQLASLEKVVFAVQEDIPWVRDDVRVVHEVVDKLSETGSMAQKTVADVAEVPSHSSPDLPAWGWRLDAATTEPHGMPDTTEFGEEDRVDLGDEEPSHIHAAHWEDSEIQETQLPDRNTGMETHMHDRYSGMDGTGKSIAGEGAGRSQHNHVTNERGMGPPPGKQARRRDDADALEYGTTQIVMTVDGTLPGTQAQGHKMWADFATAMRGIEAPALGGGSSSASWVLKKRGRGSEAEQGASNTAETRPEDCVPHGNLNLNMSPESLDGREMIVASAHAATGSRGDGREMIVASAHAATGSRGVGRGSGRGTGRVRRLPQVEPRFRSSASTRTLFALHVNVFIIYAARKRPDRHCDGNA